MWKLMVCLTLFTGVATAKSLELKTGTRTLYVQERSDWTLSKDLFGMPYVYFSPSLNGQRSNISFTDTGIELSLDVTALSKNQDDYKQGKNDWAKEVGATPISFFPYESSTNKHGHKIHTIGFNYEHEGKSYQEKSFYIECRGKLLFSKSLRLKENEAHESSMKDFIKTLDCGGV